MQDMHLAPSEEETLQPGFVTGLQISLLAVQFELTERSWVSKQRTLHSACPL